MKYIHILWVKTTSTSLSLTPLSKLRSTHLSILLARRNWRRDEFIVKFLHFSRRRTTAPFHSRTGLHLSTFNLCTCARQILIDHVMSHEFVVISLTKKPPTNYSQHYSPLTSAGWDRSDRKAPKVFIDVKIVLCLFGDHWAYHKATRTRCSVVKLNFIAVF